MKVVLAAALAGLTLGLGYHQVATHQGFPQAAPVIVNAPQAQPKRAAPKPKPRPKPKPKPKPKPRPKPKPAPRATEQSFWQLIDDTRGAAGSDTGRQTELLKERLATWSPSAILQFARIRHHLDARAYAWNLWAAAYVIEDGCSDDCFRDFRAYLILQGRGRFERALTDPDSLAPFVQDAEAGDWESADNVAPDAYSSATGNDYPLDDSDLSGRPRGKPFNENAIGALVRRFPRLAARFR
jgi:hypothetical protein